jgi:hypothetical protein
VLAKNFNYLSYPVGKGIYLIMMALVITEVGETTEFIFCIIASIIGLFNIALGITFEALKSNVVEK